MMNPLELVLHFLDMILRHYVKAYLYIVAALVKAGGFEEDEELNYCERYRELLG